jgi:serine/threonine protein kinase
MEVDEPIAVDRAIYIAVECCKALSQRETRGSISTAAIELASDGTVTISDAIGLPHSLGYAAPELINAPRCPTQTTVDHLPGGGLRYSGRVEPRPFPESERIRWEVFGLGCVLWEMLAGGPLFRGSTDYESAQLVGICHVPQLAGVPAELEAIVRTALAKDPETRYQTPAQLAAALTDFLFSGRRS